MKLRRLGSSDLTISPLGLGTWAIAGAGWEFAWGPQDRDTSIRTVEYGVERGINWIDTAAVYGLGRAEEIVGEALRRIPASRRPFVFTKGSLVWDQNTRRISHSLEPTSLAREVDASLTRLGIDVIDLYQIHWPAWTSGGPDEGIEEALGLLARLRDAGKIRAIGVSNFDVPQLRRALAVTPIASLQPPYSALMRNVEKDILPFCEHSNIGVIPYSVLQSGLLSGRMTRDRIASLPVDDWRKARSPNFREPQLNRNLALVEDFRRIGDRHRVTAAAVAIAWALRKPVVTGVIVGARKPDQVDDLLGAAAFRLSVEELAEIALLLPEDSAANVPEPA